MSPDLFLIVLIISWVLGVLVGVPVGILIERTSFKRQLQRWGRWES